MAGRPVTGGARRIGLIGAECTGKSTLAEDLAHALPACIATEQLRTFVDERGRNPQEHEQHGIMLAQQAAEDAVAASCPHGIVIGDSAPLMTAVYSIEYFDDPTLVPIAADLSRGYQLMIWCDIDMPWQPDGIQRDGPHVRAREHDIIGSIVTDVLLPAGIHVVAVSGGREQRAEAARRAWQLLPPREPT